MTAKKPKSKPANPVTPQAEAHFVMCIRKWQAALNMMDWRIERSNRPANKAHAAEIVKRDLPARLATFQIGSDFGSMHVNETTVEQMALHEDLHVFLHELMEICRDQASTTDEITAAEHRVINTLVALLVPER